MSNKQTIMEVAAPTAAFPVRLSPWVNERPPPWSQLLSAHEVARLIRRPRLVVCSLALIGRFPKKQRFRGARVGWLRSDVLEWMARDLSLEPNPPETPRRCSRRRPQQPCLPLECQSSCEKFSCRRKEKR